MNKVLLSNKFTSGQVNQLLVLDLFLTLLLVKN